MGNHPLLLKNIMVKVLINNLIMTILIFLKKKLVSYKNMCVSLHPLLKQVPEHYEETAKHQKRMVFIHQTR